MAFVRVATYVALLVDFAQRESLLVSQWLWPLHIDTNRNHTAPPEAAMYRCDGHR